MTPDKKVMGLEETDLVVGQVRTSVIGMFQKRDIPVLRYRCGKHRQKWFAGEVTVEKIRKHGARLEECRIDAKLLHSKRVRKAKGTKNPV